jgi:hypothetical protein
VESDNDLLVRVFVEEIVGTTTPSTVITPAEERARVVSVACPSSMLPTPKAVEVEAVIPLTGNPVALVNVTDVGVPKTGVTNVGDVAKTRAPEPVSSVTAEIRFADDGVAKKVATPVANPDTPVEIGNPVALVSTPDAGVPSAGVTKVGLVAKTSAPVPVSSEITPASSAEVVAARVDNLSVVTTKVLVDGIVVPLIDVAVATPSTGVTSVGLVSTTNLVPVPV